MAEKEVLLTQEGLKLLEEELVYLKGTKRLEVAERIKEARGFGDISENSEYDEAKNDQAQLEMRIMQIENMLKNTVLIDEDELSTEAVSLGTTVKLFDVDENEEVEYMIVGSIEANPKDHKISNESPVGASLIGKHVGDEVLVNVPAGTVKYKVLEISK